MNGDIKMSWDEYERYKAGYQTFNVPIKKRSLFGRIIRLPKLIKVHLQFTRNMPIKDRISFIFSSIRIVLR